MSTIGKTLNQFIIESQRAFPDASGDLSGLLNDIGVACKQIAHLVTRSGISGLGGYAETHNVQGEPQKQLDILSHDIFVQQLGWTGHLAAMISEEIEDVISIPTRYPRGQYLLAFDPLDGSSNLDVNVSVGSIFSILRCPDSTTQPGMKAFLQPGTAQVCAGFTVYGPATVLVLTLGNGVHGFTLDRDVGEFILTHPNLRIPQQTAEFAINMSNQRHWDSPVEKYIGECLAGADGVREKNFNLRWVASMVAEVYRILMRGGVFLYPIDERIRQQGGRLRLLYEANPMSFIVEQAGGLSSTGEQRILELMPTELHQRVPVILGSSAEVARLIRYHQKPE
ncbi:Fructose-1,6-bisphosphatase, type I [Methylophaga frappieri]|uniref:Fructose-1,6-bisphosphatase class 1 n=1 Tax=Methylophaga frappieri (strain ATCC BAA-2434 / DSM 25690 / JAM7) TaxID=754477 RepID=I1YJK8_METFJ|nr:class 1 fructose-bisphosphatase [Methylophaga frappieri]AFJ03101.1 Fructose-1,6-bisphosphatase, type I [Methylophaga frappieri]